MRILMVLEISSDKRVSLAEEAYYFDENLRPGKHPYCLLYTSMEAKGIRTEKGELNRWIKATNRLMQDVRKKRCV